VDIDCTVVPRLVEKALEALDEGDLDKVGDSLRLEISSIRPA